MTEREHRVASVNDFAKTSDSGIGDVASRVYVTTFDIYTCEMPAGPERAAAEPSECGEDL